MKPPRAILLDLDGTLVDSAPELALAVNEVRRAFSLPPASLETVRDWVGEGVQVLITRALHDAVGSDPPAEVLAEARCRFDAAYERVLGTDSTPGPGVAEGLRRLRAAGMPMACVTNKPERFARLLLQALNLPAPLEVVVGGDTAENRKPDPAPARLAAERLGAGIEDCLLVGDSAIDVATARNAGCPVWLLRSGYSRGQNPDELGADRVFDRFDQCVDALTARGGGLGTH